MFDIFTDNLAKFLFHKNDVSDTKTGVLKKMISLKTASNFVKKIVET